MSRKGLPTSLQMRHDSHYVDDLSKSVRTVGRRILIELLEPNPEQPRTEIGDLSELSDSIKQKGVLEPILVKPNPAAGKWLIIAGERRWRAATLAGLTEVPCIELDIDEKDIAEIALIENLQRKDLTLWEEADGFAYLVKKLAYTHEEIAKKIGKSRTTVTESLSIAGLPEDIRAKCRKHDVTTKSALLEVARQFDEAAMHSFLDRAAGEKIKKIGNTKSRGKSYGGGGDNGNGTDSMTSINNSSPNNSLAGSSQNNVYRYSTIDGDLKIELTFANSDNLQQANSKQTVLAALKKIFNEIKTSR